MVLGVERVGVDLAAFSQLEAGRAGQGDHLVLAHVAALVVSGHVRGGAMLDHAQGATGLEHVVEGLEHALGLAAATPVVHVAEGHHHVRRAGRAEHRCLRVVGHHGGLLELRRGVGELLLQPVPGLLLVVAATTFLDRQRIDNRRHVVALFLQVRCQDLGVPAAAGGDFHHGHVRTDAEEGQGLAGVAIRIARDVGRIAPGAGDGRIQCGVGGRRRGGFGGGLGRRFGGRGCGVLLRRTGGQGQGEQAGAGNRGAVHRGTPGRNSLRA